MREGENGVGGEGRGGQYREREEGREGVNVREDQEGITIYE